MCQSTNLSTTTSIAPRVRRLALPNPPANLSKMDQVPGCNLTATFPARPLALGCFYPALPDEAPARHNLISRQATFAGPLNKGHRSETAVLRVSFAQSLEAIGLSSTQARSRSHYTQRRQYGLLSGALTRNVRCALLRLASQLCYDSANGKPLPVIGHPGHSDKTVIRDPHHATTS